MRADEAAIEGLTLELARSGIALRALVPDAASLEERFFALTEDPAPGETPTARPRARAGGVMPHTLSVYRWELRKLVAQKRTYLGLAAATIAPTIFVVALAVQNGAPNDVPFGRYVRDIGPGRAARPADLRLDLALPADRLAGRRGHRRRRGRQRHAQDHPHAQRDARAAVRGQGRRGDHLRAARAGRHGRRLDHGGDDRLGLQPRSRASRDDRLGLARPRPGARQPRRLRVPLLAITTIGVLLSTVTRNSAGAVVGALMIALLMQLIGILPGVGAIKPYLLTTQFDAWHGFLRTPIDWEHEDEAAPGRDGRTREARDGVEAPGDRRLCDRDGGHGDQREQRVGDRSTDLCREHLTAGDAAREDRLERAVAVLRGDDPATSEAIRGRARSSRTSSRTSGAARPVSRTYGRTDVSGRAVLHCRCGDEDRGRTGSAERGAERRALRPLRARHGPRRRRWVLLTFGSIWLFPLIEPKVSRTSGAARPVSRT